MFGLTVWEYVVAPTPAAKLTGPVGTDRIAESAGEVEGEVASDAAGSATDTSAVGRVDVMVESVGTEREATASAENELGPWPTAGGSMCMLISRCISSVGGPMPMVWGILRLPGSFRAGSISTEERTSFRKRPVSRVSHEADQG